MKRVIVFEADEQNLRRKGELVKCASGTINYLIASFELGANWQNFDRIFAIWKNKTREEPVMLNSEGECIIPSIVLKDEGIVRVNLQGIEEDRARLTTFSAEAVIIDEVVPVDGEPSQPMKRDDIKN